MAMTREEWKTLVDGLAEANDGAGLDNFAVLSSEVNELLDETDKLTGRITELEQQNGALKKENFKLFSRVGAPSTAGGTEVPPPAQEEEVTDYMKDLVDENGRWI